MVQFLLQKEACIQEHSSSTGHWKKSGVEVVVDDIVYRQERAK